MEEELTGLGRLSAPNNGLQSDYRLLSYSQISTFVKCPELWYQRYILGKDGPQPPWFRFGEVVHEGLRDYWYEGLKVSLDKITDDLFPYSRTPNNETKLARALVVKGLDLLSEIDVDIDASMYLHPEYEIIYNDFIGIIDLPARTTDNKIIIVDWKTTSSEYTEHHIKTSDQLTCYSWLFALQQGFLPDKVYYITLNKKTCSGRIWAAARTLQQVLDWQKKVDIVRQQMNQTIRYKNPDGCVYKDIYFCDFYRQCWPTKDNNLIKFT